MLAISRRLAGTPEPPPVDVLPYGATYNYRTGALPTAHSINRMIAAAHKTVEAFVFTMPRVGLMPLVFPRGVSLAVKLRFFALLFPKYAPHVPLVAIPRTPQRFEAEGHVALVPCEAAAAAAAPLCVTSPARRVLEGAAQGAAFMGAVARAAVATMSPGTGKRFVVNVFAAVDGRVDDRAALVALSAVLPELPSAADVFKGTYGGEAASFGNIYRLWHGELKPAEGDSALPATRHFRAAGAYAWVRPS